LKPSKIIIIIIVVVLVVVVNVCCVIMFRERGAEGVGDVTERTRSSVPHLTEYRYAAAATAPLTAHDWGTIAAV